MFLFLSRTHRLGRFLIAVAPLLWMGHAPLSAMAGPVPEAADRAKPLNILYIVADDFGIMDTSVYNPDTFYETPNLDRLAASGMVFERGYVPNPICTPSRYALMTGRYPTRAQVTNFSGGKRLGRFLQADFHKRLPLEEITIGELLEEVGYRTAFFGKWHLGPSEAYYPESHGFDLNVGGNFRGGPGSGKGYFAPFENPQLQPESPPGDHLPDRLAREVNAFMEADPDQPFLACLNFYSVHTPLMGRPDLVAKYEKKAKSVQGEAFGQAELVFSFHPKAPEQANRTERTERILQKHAVYAAMVEAMDEAIGKVLRKLEALGLAGNTLVIFTSDHGGLSTRQGSPTSPIPTSNRPFRGGKGWLYEGGVRVPLMIRYPGVTASGSTYAAPVSTLDLYPMIAAAVGAGIRHEIDGVDLTPVLEGGRIDRGPLYWHFPHYSNEGGFPGGAILDGDWKLIQRYEDGAVQLYDVVEDISEQDDLAPQHPEQVEAMRAELHRWLRDQNARFLRQRPEPGSPEPWRPY